MTVEAKFTTAGMTKGKQYDVIEEKKCVNAYKIVLDDGTIAFRHRCGFKVVNENGRQVDIMYKVQYMNYKTKEIAEEEFKHPKHALSRYLTIGESMKENGIDICSLKIFNQKGNDITGKVNHFIIEM